MNGGIDKYFFQGSKITDAICATIGFKDIFYSFELKEGDNRFVFSKEELGNNSLYTAIGAFGNEANIKSYSGLSIGEHIRRYLSEIKKYHFHDTGKSSPFTKESHIVNDTYFLYEKGGNLAAFLYGIREKEPIVYKRIIRVIQSIAPYFSDFYFNVSAAQTFPTEPSVSLLWLRCSYSLCRLKSLSSTSLNWDCIHLLSRHWPA